MTCARREAGAQQPAPSAESPREPDPRPGRFHARLFRLLPVLALLFGALSLLAAAPIQAQTTVWSATLTVDKEGNFFGCDDSDSNQDDCTAALTDNNFVFKNTTYTVKGIYVNTNQEFYVDLDKATPSGSLVLRAGDTELSIASASRGNTPAGVANGQWSWGNTGLSWSDNQQVSVTLIQPPGVVTGLGVTAGNAKLDLSWTAPTGTVTGYDVHYTSASDTGQNAVGDDDAASGNDATAGWVAVSRSGATASQSITGLTNGTTYRVRVRAKNGAGNSGWVRDTGTPVADPVAPSVPRNVTVTPGDGKLTMSWEAPASWGTWPAEAYFVQWKLSSAGATDWSFVMRDNEVVGIGADATSFVFTGSQADGGGDPYTVTNGTAYDLRIQAISQKPGGSNPDTDLLRSDLVTVTNKVPAVPASNVPTGLSVTTGNAQLTASWTAPSGVDVARYEAQIKLKSAASWPTGDTDVTGTSHTFTGLTNGSPYQVRVRTVQTGEGVAGDWTAPVEGTPQVPPDLRVTNLAAASGDGKLTVTWTNPRVLDVLDALFIRWRVQNTNTWLNPDGQTGGELSGEGNRTSYEITGLTGGTTYDVEVKTSLNGATPSDWVSTTGTPLAPPTVTLSVSPNPVLEGSVVFVTATLSRTLSSQVRIPLTVTRGSAESGDYTAPTAIRINAGSLAYTGGIQTNQDTDEDDETFTVALGTLPSTVTAGTPSSLEVTITDDDGLRLSAETSHPTPACGAAVTDLAVRPETGLRLTPRPAAATETQVRILASYGPAEGWRTSLPIRRYDRLPTYGHSGFVRNITFAELRKNFPGFRGFEYRLKDTTAITAQCTWRFDGDDVGTSGQSPGASPGTAGELGVIAASPGPYAALIAQMYEWREDPQWRHRRSHTSRWDRALLAFGETVADSSLTAMSAAEAQALADSGLARWVEVAKALWQIEGGGTQTPALPVVTIAAGEEAVTESALVVFTVTATPAPVSDLDVTVTVGQEGAFVYDWALGAYTVTIPAGGTSEALEVLTVDDAVDEPDGAVVVSLTSGAGYALGAAKRARVAVADDDESPPGILTKRSIAREGADAAVVFAVRLDRAASQTVTVDYATADGAGLWARLAPARSGADYTATSGTLTFAAGETSKTISVPILDDSIDEGMEYFLLRFSNPQGATLAAGERETQGLIRNSDPLQAMWLARFGRMVASDAVASVTSRLETPRDAGSHVTFAGQRMNFGEAEGGGGAALATVLTGLARTFGAPSAPAADDKDDPFARHGLTSGWNDPAAATGARRVTGRELLLGTSFRAVLGQGAGSQWTSWGQGASVSHFSAAVPGLGLTGESATGSMGMDYERGRLLMGLAMTHSVGEGTAQDAGWRYALGSTATMAMPYARLALSDRVSVWGLAGTGSGTLSLDLDGSVPQSYRTDLAMTLAAAGVQGDLVTPAEPGGFALALKADAFWVRTESDRVTASEFGSLMGARGESSRVRAVLDGSRTFSFASGAALTPKLELGVRHDAGDAETGTGLEVGAGLGYADPSRGLDMALRVHGLAVHAADGYDEWGVSGQISLVPGDAGRGLSMSLTPSWGVDPSGSERLWALPASSGLAANGEAEPSSRFDAEVGYGMALLGDRFTGTPNVGFGMSDTARDYRIGWRLTSANASGFEIGLDATRREAVNDNDAEHGVMVSGALRW